MFPQAAEVLKAREGSLAETPLPLLLSALLAEERTCTLELKIRALQKRIFFEEGAPVGCSSNLLHETLGKYLVEKGKVREEQYQKALLETVETGKKMGEVLVQHRLLAPFDLYKQLQANLAHKILDCFRWADAGYRILGDPPEVDTPVKMNTRRLILTGATTVLPFDVVCTHLAFADEQRFAAEPGVDTSDLKLSAKDARVLQLLKGRPVFAELAQRTGLDTEALMRRLYAFCVLGLAGFAETVKGAPPAAPTAQGPATGAHPAAPTKGGAAAHGPAPSAAPAPAAADERQPVAAPAGIPFADDDAELKNALVSAFLEHRNKDPFLLLGVTEQTPFAMLRKAFLVASDRFSPLRFQSADLREKAEALLLAFARAYATLSDPEQLELWRRRRRAQQERQASQRPSTAEQFRIDTSLLDGQSQFAEGSRRLEAGNVKGAFEHYEYACDIEPRPLFRAHRAWARYLLNPKAHARLALSELEDLTRADPPSEHGHFFAGQIHRAEGRFAEAEECYRQAFRINPQHREYADLTHEMARLKKKGA